ncbi:HlyD family efflux transporter periplasmic adaptor subunit [Polymorphobacter fuscus]|uniref:HlyD family efflux transporter periplasmic adaptor subunit n=1 Tax=Sandarakinorhabdus fusca TaxID=1439888 RepID=A0A7C9GQC8_9SPHN|nr:HlyD family efflux transporter periplasmic adaptor subunit [Polymorphobacter fuscus]KAB7646331.1 HlyD family efflux transporter periplasmic adaptor subunit [Polymorphobacter fuscus]MQT17556.1 HlyD family efflux transporter periplasmic adaptor subunit [Polymorphobacter fuscus]NJC09902.1 membrane fusion protein (multidrug efflux system) [Polymorphobacter fuscus]
MADADPQLTVPPEAAGADPKVAARAATRKRLFRILGLVLLVAAIGYALYWFVIGRNNVTTDNAYVGANSAQVTALTSAAILRVPVMETDVVRAGDVLVELDPADARLALAQAEAQLASAERRVAGYYAQGSALQAQLKARGADIGAADARVASAEADLKRARINLQRRQAIQASGAVSGDELTAAQNAEATAIAAVSVARAARAEALAQVGAAKGTEAVNTALIAGSSARENPEVRAARAAVDRARLDLDRTIIRAPLAGVIARKNADIGQRVAPGTALMTIVPVETAFVDANFKESQLQKVRVGQKVTLTSDLYGSDVVYHGRVSGLGGGTGAAFALIPAQNASGNWIKVVQRLPVRILLDPKELREHPLRIGLSMEADIDVSGAN